MMHPGSFLDRASYRGEGVEGRPQGQVSSAEGVSTIEATKAAALVILE